MYRFEYLEKNIKTCEYTWGQIIIFISRIILFGDEFIPTTVNKKPGVQGMSTAKCPGTHLSRVFNTFSGATNIISLQCKLEAIYLVSLK